LLGNDVQKRPIKGGAYRKDEAAIADAEAPNRGIPFG
jgi:hypothetical protein